MLSNKRTKHATPYSRNNSSPLPAESKFQHPFTMIVPDPTMSGKSTWMKQLLLSDLITPPPNRIVWLYKRWQSLYDELKDQVPHLEFIQGIPDNLNSDTFLNEQERTFVFTKDLMKDATENKDVRELFVEGAHHRNLSTACIMQNLFNKGKENRTMSLNSQYLVLFKNPRDQQRIATLARQKYPAHSEKILDAYQRATEVPHGSLVVDLKQSTPDAQRLRTDIFADEMTKPSCIDCHVEFEDKHDMISHTLKGCPMETVSNDGEPAEEDEAAYDELIDAVWKEHNPILQRKVTELMEEDDISEEEAGSVAREQMLHRDKVLFMKKYKDILQFCVRLMGSSLHRAIQEELLRLTDKRGLPLEEAITKTLNEHKSEFDSLFVEN